MNSERNILRFEVQQAVLKLEQAFMQYLIASKGSATVPVMASELELTEMKVLGDEAGLACARGLARSLERKGYITLDRRGNYYAKIK